MIPLSDARVATLRADLRAIGGSTCARLLRRCVELLEDATADAESARATECASTAAILTDAAWEKLHTGDWKDAEPAWRDLYALATLLRVRASATRPPRDPPASALGDSALLHDPTAALRALDVAALLGGPTFRSELDVAIRAAAARNARATAAAREGSTKRHRADTEADADADTSEEESGAFRWCIGDPDPGAATATELPPHALGVGITSPGAVPAPVARSPVRRYEEPPSLETFLLEHFARSSPALLVGGCACWPARTRWRDPEFLRDVAGVRTVPVEYGPDYLHPEWTQELTTVATLLRRDIRPRRTGSAARRIGYLAQHALFDQIPELKSDVRTPDYCALSAREMGSQVEGDGVGGEGYSEERPVATNAWLGPAGTVSPLHRDSHHGLLSQVLGRKYVRLYAPRHERAMYPRDVAKESNASSVDLAAERGRATLSEETAQAFPEFAKAPFLDVILEEGDQLYVPPEWWHYVQSMTSSFSVSHWWG